MYIDNIIQKLNKRNANLQPCTEEEVFRLENHYNIKFPYAYKEYLLTMGHYADELYIGSCYTYDDLFLMKESILEEDALAKQHNLIKRSFNWKDENVFPFFDHGGYLIYFFRVDEGDNPPVYVYNEGSDDIVKTYISFSAFFEEQFFIFYEKNRKVVLKDLNGIKKITLYIKNLLNLKKY